MTPDPLAYEYAYVCYKPPTSERAPRGPCVSQEITTFQAYAFDAAPNFHLKDEVPFVSSIFVSTHSACYTCLMV